MGREAKAPVQAKGRRIFVDAVEFLDDIDREDEELADATTPGSVSP